MYRVLFRVIKISIHIKQTLSLEYLFKKHHHSIPSKDLFPLQDGISYINTTTQFLVHKDDPNFQLHVNFTFQNVKKQAGFIHVHLNQCHEATSYQEIRKLQNAPGGKAIIEFGFIYFDANIGSPLPKSLESFEVFERDMSEDYKEKILEQNAILGEKLKELTNLKDSLTDQKQNYNQMEQEFSKLQAEINEELNEQEKRMDEANLKLREEQEKEEFLRRLVENSGSEDLMNYMKELNSNEMRMESSEIGSEGQSTSESHSF